MMLRRERIRGDRVPQLVPTDACVNQAGETDGTTTASWRVIMQTWEYRSEPVRREELNATLTQRAADGWEFVAFAPEEITGNTQFGIGDLKTRVYRVVFRRPQEVASK